MGQLDAQGVGGAGASLSATVEHNNDGTGSPEMKQWRRKNRAKGRGQTAMVQAIKDGQAAQGSCAMSFTAPARRQNSHDRAWNAEEGNAGNVASAVDTVHSIYRNAIRPKFTNYSQIFITTQKSPKTKVVQNQKFYHFAFETIPKFGLHFEMNF